MLCRINASDSSFDLRAVVLGTFIAIAPATGVLATPPTDAQRFDRLAERVEAARVEQHIPGVALAVVRDDEIVFARGFGLANIEEAARVTPETVFAIGSTTKAFTSAVIAMLVDEGCMSWDDPVSKWLPAYTPEIDGEKGEVILIRDMLSHRTGFTRMSMLFVSGTVPREEILRVANDAEPWAPFRERFLYNNVMYVAAGMYAGAAAGSSWEALIRERLFEPLGMDDSNLTLAAAQVDPRLALGYVWEEDEHDWQHTPMRNLDQIGPAGSINSNVLDMAEWIRLQLGRGTYAGRRLIAEDTHAEMWTPQITVAGDVKYGFGWMLRKWNGQRLIEHGGNIDGFAAQVSLLPDANLGYVLLTNTGFAPLQAGSIDIVFDAMVGDWEVGSEKAAAETGLEEFEGVYIANYAQFDDERFTVSVMEDGRLGIDIPSQRTFALDASGPDGRRAFADVPGIAATFERDENGDVQLLRLYQGGLKFEVPREGFTYPIEIPLEQLEKYQGKYRFDAMNADIEVLIKNNHLAVDVPNQMVYELHPPDDTGKWQFRHNDVMQIAVSFEDGAFAHIESMTMYQAGQEFVMPRLPDVANGEVPSLEDVFALAHLDDRQKALDSAATLQISGEARFAQSGVVGTVVITFDAGEHHRTDIDLGPFGLLRTSVDGDRGWVDFSFTRFDELSGRKLEAVKRDHPASFLGDWRAFYEEVRVDGLDEVDEKPVIVVKVAGGDLPGATFYLASDTGDILKIDSAVELPELGNVRVPVTTYLRDWRDVNGLRIPHEMTVETQQNGRFVVRIRAVRQGVTLEPGFFTLERAEE